MKTVQKPVGLILMVAGVSIVAVGLSHWLGNLPAILFAAVLPVLLITSLDRTQFVETKPLQNPSCDTPRPPTVDPPSVTKSGPFATLESRERRRERDKEELIEALEKQNQELERFTYTVSHDLKSPLVTITGFLGLIKEDLRAGDLNRVDSSIKRIESAATRMRQLLDDLLKLSRVGRIADPSQVVPFGELVHEALAMCAGHITSQNAVARVQEDLPDVVVDRTRIIEVLQNLIENALKFASPERTLEIAIGVDRERVPITFFVRDNGLGIEPSFQARVFDLFSKYDPATSGTGIGLALVKRIIEVHNGVVWVEANTDDSGACFFFTLPVV